MEVPIEEKKEKYKISEEEFQKNLTEVFNELAIYAKEVQNPKFIFVGGQAGAGKTDLVAKKYNDLEGNAIIIDQDELRTKYPQEIYKKIVEENNDRDEYLILKDYMSRIIRELLTKAGENNYNIIFETALQRITKHVDFANSLREKGYELEVSVISVSELESNLSMIYRYCHYLEKDGFCRRNATFNPKSLNNMFDNIEYMDGLGIFNDIEVYSRGENRGDLPCKVYSKTEKPNERPNDAIRRVNKLSMDGTIKNFEAKYNQMKNILMEYGEAEKLEILENLYNEFISIQESER